MQLICLIASLVCFILAAVNASVPRVNLLAVGLALLVASMILIGR